MTGREPLVDAVRRALDDVEKQPKDAGAVQLALAYAEAIDGVEEKPGDLIRLGPGLLAVLESLGMTPKGRAAVLGKGVSPRDNVPRSKADELRERRAAREHAAEAVD